MITENPSRTLREINPDSQSEIELVAKRMRQTLIDVLGEEKGSEMYSLEWLRERVLWHLNPENTIAKIFLSESANGYIAGHAIARIEHNKDGTPYGYFSTIYVEPESREQGVAKSFLVCVERWFLERDIPNIIYNTAESNSKLIALFHKHGYSLTEAQNEMVQLTKMLGKK